MKFLKLYSIVLSGIWLLAGIWTVFNETYIIIEAHRIFPKSLGYMAVVLLYNIPLCVYLKHIHDHKAPPKLIELLVLVATPFMLFLQLVMLFLQSYVNISMVINIVLSVPLVVYIFMEKSKRQAESM